MACERVKSTYYKIIYDVPSLLNFRPKYAHISPLSHTPAVPIQQILLKLLTLIIFRKGNDKIVPVHAMKARLGAAV